MSYEINILEVPARVVDFSKRSARAAFFVHESTAPTGRESLSDRLNRESAIFLPCQIEGERGLLNVAYIAYVELLGPNQRQSELERVGARSEGVELDLVTDEVLRGQILFEARAEDRLSDLLNSGSARFLLLSDTERTLYVQRDAIRRVRFTAPTATQTD